MLAWAEPDKNIQSWKTQKSGLQWVIFPGCCQPQWRVHTITSCHRSQTCVSTSSTSLHTDLHTHTHSSTWQSLESLIPITAVLWQTSLVLLDYSQPHSVTLSQTHTHTTSTRSLWRPIVQLSDSECERWRSVSTNEAWLHREQPDNRCTSLLSPVTLGL